MTTTTSTRNLGPDLCLGDITWRATYKMLSANEHRPDMPHGAEASAWFATEADRDEILALFPKSLRVKATDLSTWDRDTNESVVLPGFIFSVNLTSTGTTGTVNETGIRRLTKFRQIAASTGRLVYRAGYVNSYPSPDAFDAAVFA